MKNEDWKARALEAEARLDASMFFLAQMWKEMARVAAVGPKAERALHTALGLALKLFVALAHSPNAEVDCAVKEVPQSARDEAMALVTKIRGFREKR